MITTWYRSRRKASTPHFSPKSRTNSPNPTHCQPQPLLTRKRQQKAPLAGSRKAAETGPLELGSNIGRGATSMRRGSKVALHDLLIISSCWNYGPSIGRWAPHLRPGRQRPQNRAFQQFQHISNYLPSIGRAPHAAASFLSYFPLQIQRIGIGLHHRRKQRLAVFSALRLQPRTNSVFSAYWN